MNRSQVQAAIFAILVLVMVGVYARAFHAPRPVQGPSPSVEPPHDQPSAQTPNVVLPLAADSREAQRQRLAELKWTRDPFTSLGTGQLSDLALSGILWDATQPLAIINGTMVHTGQEVDGYRVVAITQDQVSLTDGSETVQLHLAP